MRCVRFGPRLFRGFFILVFPFVSSSNLGLWYLCDLDPPKSIYEIMMDETTKGGSSTWPGQQARSMPARRTSCRWTSPSIIPWKHLRLYFCIQHRCTRTFTAMGTYV
uniref:Uncharacterized protein n=1 Tax=Arundo donax TaxID=35708 RepID=A0A0A9G2L8_ARUDO